LDGWEEDGALPFDCLGRDEVFRSVWLRPVPAETAGKMIVEALLQHEVRR
jgi:hypothetical protein